MNTVRAATRRKQRDDRDLSLSREPANPRTLFASRQGNGATTDPFPPEPLWDEQEGAGDAPCNHILILDVDLNHAEALAAALNLVGLEASVVRAREVVIAAIKQGEVDLVIIVPRSPSWWRSDLKSFCEAIRDVPDRPEIMCVLPWPAKGPGDRIVGDEVNAAVLHEE